MPLSGTRKKTQNTLTSRSKPTPRDSAPFPVVSVPRAVQPGVRPHEFLATMPKRSNDFQRLVYLVRLNLAAGAHVTESKMMRDRLTRRFREVDVVIKGKVGSQPVVVCVECRDHKRVADVTWVDTTDLAIRSACHPSKLLLQFIYALLERIQTPSKHQASRHGLRGGRSYLGQLHHHSGRHSRKLR